MTAYDQVRRLALEWTVAAAERGMTVAFHEAMPSRVGDLEIAVELIEGRHDGEVALIRNCHLFEGGGVHQLPLTPGTLGDRECRARIAAWMAPAARILEDEAAMRARGVDPLDPPLSELRASPIVGDVIAWADMHSSAYRVDRNNAGGLVHPPSGMAKGRISMKAVRRDDPDDFVMSLQLSGRRLYAGRITLKGRNRLRIIEVDDRDVEITVVGTTLPESVLAAAAGRSLGELLTHPAICQSGSMEIVTAANQTDTLGPDSMVIIARGVALPAHPIHRRTT